MHRINDIVDWEVEEQAALELLCELLRFDTSNPPGNERDCAKFLAEWLWEGGLEPEVIMTGKRRSNVIVRLKGKAAGPLLLAGHLDVVPANPDKWIHPPFAGEIHDGYVWGRGAVDMKHMVAMSAVVMRILAQLNVSLDRDLIFVAVADEEAGCDLGSAWLVDHRADLVRAEHALGEVGGSTHQLAHHVFYPVQVAEKGLCWVRAKATGGAGHGSMPRADNAVIRLAQFVSALRKPLCIRSSLELDRFIREIGGMTALSSGVLATLAKHPLASRHALRWLVSDPGSRKLLHAALRNTVSPTVLSGGERTNVIPDKATVELDGRIAIGSSAEDLIAEIEKRSGNHVEFEPLKTHPPSVAPIGTVLLGHISDVISEHHPGARVVHSITPGFTDGAYWSQLGTKCYGFTPVRLPAGPEVPFEDLYHAHNERVSVEGFKGGLRMLGDVVFRHCVA